MLIDKSGKLPFNIAEVQGDTTMPLKQFVHMAETIKFFTDQLELSKNSTKQSLEQAIKATLMFLHLADNIPNMPRTTSYSKYGENIEQYQRMMDSLGFSFTIEDGKGLGIENAIIKLHKYPGS